MKNSTIKRQFSPLTKRGDRGLEHPSTELVDEQPQLPLAEKVPKPKEFRHRCDDVNHRFGKSAGST